MPTSVLRYKRSRFATRLPTDRFYSRSHFWMQGLEEGQWRVGFTKFATRMLGEIVDLDFEVQEGQALETGQVVGWIEGFKAVTDVFTPMAGSFAGANPRLQQDIEKISSDPYENGWLFALRGSAGREIPGPDVLDAQGYSDFLDLTIDKMTGRGA